MTQTPAGWYPDHQQAVLRYWDGSRWTEHTSPFPQGEAGGPGVATGGAPASSYGYGPAGGASYDKRATTPDGERLAGWWARVGASILDGLIIFAFATPLALPAWREVFSVYGDYFDEVSTTGASGTTNVMLTSEIAGPILVIGLVALAVNFVYNVGFLLWKQATPGKLVVGLRVRRRDTPHGLPLPVVLKRWALQGGPQLLGVIPVIGSLASLFTLLDSLWPLWDSRRQAIHEKWADTNVVVRRR